MSCPNIFLDFITLTKLSTDHIEINICFEIAVFHAELSFF